MSEVLCFLARSQLFLERELLLAIKQRCLLVSHGAGDNSTGPFELSAELKERPSLL